MRQFLAAALTSAVLAAPAAAGTFTVNLAGPTLDPVLSAAGSGVVTIGGGSAQIAFPPGSGSSFLSFPRILGDFVASVDITRSPSFLGTVGISADYLIPTDGNFDYSGAYLDANRIQVSAGGSSATVADNSLAGTFTLQRTGVRFGFAFNGRSFTGPFSFDPTSTVTLFASARTNATLLAATATTISTAATVPLVGFSNFRITGPNVADSAVVTPVPEPMSLALLASGVAAVVSLRHSRRTVTV